MLEISIIRCCVEIVASPSNRITMKDPVSSETKQSAKNNILFWKKQLLVSLMDMEWLPIGHQVTIWPELFIIS